MARSSRAQRPSSVARTLNIIGDRWTFLMLREAFFGVRRFDEMQRNLGIARNILANRLKRLVAHDIFERRQYQDRPPRYEYRLTERGLDLYGVVLALIRWGDTWLAKEVGPPLLLRHTPCQHELTARMTCDHCGAEVRALDVTYAEGPGVESGGVRSSGGTAE